VKHLLTFLAWFAVAAFIAWAASNALQAYMVPR
jgi:hypothetical protein